MHLTHLTTSRRQGFTKKTLHRRKERHLKTLTYLKQKSSFLIAAVSLVAFVAGNMIGSHGVYAFWKSVFGKMDDSLIVYSGTVAPIAQVPDNTCWRQFGGGGEEEYTFRQVPQQCLVPLPRYDASAQRSGHDPHYSVGYMGSYSTGDDGSGSHPGVDIRAPKGTPVLAMAAGFVTSVREDNGGFGKVVVIRHPHMPDPRNPSQTMVLFSAYAHLDAQLVAEGDIVQKGQLIGLVGRTGDATGTHLHFQVDREKMPDGEEVPWHPTWPYSATDARNAGMSFTQAINSALNQDVGYRTTVSPVAYAQANYPPVQGAIAGAGSSSSLAVAQAMSASSQVQRTLLAMSAARRQLRLAQQKKQIVAAATDQAIASRTTVAVADDAEHAVQTPPTHGTLKIIEIQHDDTFSGRGWKTVTLTLLDALGNRVDGSTLDQDLYLRTAYGTAEFRPAVVSSLDFHDGRAEVRMLPRGRQTIVIMLQPSGQLGAPMRYEGK